MEILAWPSWDRVGWIRDSLRANLLVTTGLISRFDQIPLLALPPTLRIKYFFELKLPPGLTRFGIRFYKCVSHTQIYHRLLDARRVHAASRRHVAHVITTGWRHYSVEPTRHMRRAPPAADVLLPGCRRQLLRVPLRGVRRVSSGPYDRVGRRRHA